MDAHKREAHRQNAKYHVFTMDSKNQNLWKLNINMKSCMYRLYSLTQNSHRPCTVLRCHHPAPECSPRWGCRGARPPSRPGWRCCSQSSISPVAAEALQARMVLIPLEGAINKMRREDCCSGRGRWEGGLTSRGVIEGERQRGRCKKITFASKLGERYWSFNV